ncbi:MAG: ABC transporter ATP-binding protein [Treponema sp.]|nr:ABC transporter ATP-binding protein [Treponema sp.]
MIEVKDLSAWYEEDTPVFKNVSFKLSDNSFTALCGKNGSGKSTLLSLIAGIVPDGLKYSGEVLLDGKNLFEMKREEAAQNISFLLQSETPAWNFSVRHFVETGLYAFGRMSQTECDKAVDQALEKTGIPDFADKKVLNLSGGEFQKCRLARCFVQKTKTILFDEPAEKLDLPFQLKFLEKISSLEKTILFSIHDLNTASLFATDFLLLSNGQLIQADRATIFDKELLTTAYSTQATIFTHPVKNVPQVLFL